MMARLVMKFGGAYVGDGNRLRHVGGLVKRFGKDNEIVLVTSALQGVTDELLNMARKAAGEGNVTEILDFIKRLTEKHYRAIAESIKDQKIADEVRREVSIKLSELEKAYVGICYIG